MQLLARVLICGNEELYTAKAVQRLLSAFLIMCAINNDNSLHNDMQFEEIKPIKQKINKRVQKSHKKRWKRPCPRHHCSRYVSHLALQLIPSALSAHSNDLSNISCDETLECLVR